VLGLDGDAERGVEASAVLLVVDHEWDPQLVQPLSRHGQADQPTAVAGHEVDDLRRGLLGGDGQIAFVLAVLVVHDDDHPP